MAVKYNNKEIIDALKERKRERDEKEKFTRTFVSI